MRFDINILRQRVLPVIGKKTNSKAVDITQPEVNKKLTNTRGLKPNRDKIANVKTENYKVAQVHPLTLKISEKEIFYFEHEPIISVNGENIIAKRSVAKGTVRGTVKERWAMNDWEIQISGMLIGNDDEYPSDKITQLQKFLEIPIALGVECKPLQNLGIHKIVIDSYDFPFTAGANRQAFEIKACSDNEIPLFIKI